MSAPALPNHSPTRPSTAKPTPSPYLQHSHENVTTVAILLLALGADAVHQVQEQLAGHGLDVARQRFVVDILGEELDGERQVGEGQVLPDVMHKVSQRAVGQRPRGGAGSGVLHKANSPLQRLACQVCSYTLYQHKSSAQSIAHPGFKHQTTQGGVRSLSGLNRRPLTANMTISPQCLPRSVTGANQDGLVKQLIHAGNELCNTREGVDLQRERADRETAPGKRAHGRTTAQVRGQDVLGSDEQLLAQVGGLGRAV